MLHGERVVKTDTLDIAHTMSYIQWGHTYTDFRYTDATFIWTVWPRQNLSNQCFSASVILMPHLSGHFCSSPKCSDKCGLTVYKSKLL